jgi:hypothetical protein
MDTINDAPKFERMWWHGVPRSEFETRVATMPEAILLDLKRELRAAKRQIAVDLETRKETDPTWRARAKLALASAAWRSDFVSLQLGKLQQIAHTTKLERVAQRSPGAPVEENPQSLAKQERHAKHVDGLREALALNKTGDVQSAVDLLLRVLLREV